MKKTIYSHSLPRFILFKVNRIVRVNPDSIQGYNNLKEDVSKAGQLEKWDNGDDAQNKINSDCGTAVIDHGDATKKEVDSVHSKTEADIAEIRNSIGAEPSEKKGREHSEWEKKKQQAETKIKEVSDEGVKKEKGLWQEHETARTRMYQMRDQAIIRMRAAFKARDEAKEKTTEKMRERMNERTDSTTRTELSERARFAQDLADDGTFSSWGGEVKDYLDSDINGVKINDSDIEDMTMGIASVMHVPKSEKGNDPARKFMKGLSDKEDASGEFWSTDDRGVRIEDVQLQILEGLGHKAGDRYEREDARNSPEGKCIAQVASNNDLPPTLRGMLLGHLTTAGSKPEDIKKKLAEVQSMYETLQQVSAQSKDAVGVGHTGGTAFLDSMAGGSAIAAMAGVLPAAALTLLFESAAQGYRDENKLERSGAIFEALKDLEFVKRFGAQAVRYQQLQNSVEGFKDDNVEKIIVESKDSISAQRNNIRPLTEAINTAEAKAKDAKIDRLRNGQDYKKAQNLYRSLGVDFVYDNQIDSLKSKSLADISTGLGEIEQRLAHAEEDQALQEAKRKKMEQEEKDRLAARSSTPTRGGATGGGVSSAGGGGGSIGGEGGSTDRVPSGGSSGGSLEHSRKSGNGTEARETDDDGIEYNDRSWTDEKVNKDYHTEDTIRDENVPEWAKAKEEKIIERAKGQKDVIKYRGRLVEVQKGDEKIMAVVSDDGKIQGYYRKKKSPDDIRLQE